MTPDDIVDLAQRAMWITIMAAGPLLIAGMLVGLIISIFQSVTQIQEITLTFVPKILVVFAAFVIFLPYMGDLVLTFVQELFTEMGAVARR